MKTIINLLLILIFIPIIMALLMYAVIPCLLNEEIVTCSYQRVENITNFFIDPIFKLTNIKNPLDN